MVQALEIWCHYLLHHLTGANIQSDGWGQNSLKLNDWIVHTLIHRTPPRLILLRTFRDRVRCRILISAAVSVQYQHAT